MLKAHLATATLTVQSQKINRHKAHLFVFLEKMLKMKSLLAQLPQIMFAVGFQ